MVWAWSEYVFSTTLPSTTAVQIVVRPDWTMLYGRIVSKWYSLLNSTTNLRKHRTGIRSNQSHHAGDDHKDDGQHDGVFRDVLPVGLLP